MLWFKQKSTWIALMTIVMLTLGLAIFVHAQTSNFQLSIQPTACIDGIDNDGDGKIDFPSDPGCSSSADNSEIDPANAGGGGGGGGGGGLPSLGNENTSGVLIKGLAYQKSKINFLKDGQKIGDTVADNGGFFSVKAENLVNGNYLFAIQSFDPDNVRTKLYTIPVTYEAGKIVVVDSIMVPPTLQADKKEVSKGDRIVLFGYSAPNAAVKLTILNNQEFQKIYPAVANNKGQYEFSIDTSEFAFTDYKASVSGTFQTYSSGPSDVIVFKVGNANVLTEKNRCGIADLNCDTRVNLIDFSIAAFWYLKPAPPKDVDINGDGVISIIDFSIMAFYWTG